MHPLCLAARGGTRRPVPPGSASVEATTPGVGDSSDRTIAALRAQHDRLAGIVAGLSDDALTGPSGASQWRLCDVLSHLDSGAEIRLRPLRAAAEGVEPPAADNQAIWDRWNAASPRKQATGFVEHDAELVGLLEGLDAATRADLRVEVGRLPQPVPLETAAAMPLNEVAHHGWDVRVGLDPSATLDEAAADVLLTLYAGPLAIMLGFTTKPDELSEPARVEAGAWVLVVDDGVRLEPAGGETTATFTGAPEALARLITGRLGPQHTPAGTEVSGNVDLDDLRRVFAGY